MNGTRLLAKSLLATFSLLLSLAFVELSLRIIQPSDYYVWQPNLEKIFEPAEDVMPGISGESRFLINESGVRGSSFAEPGGYRVLMLGGSTTECLYLDQVETWPHLVKEGLDDSLGDTLLRVGNAGRSGRNSRHHRLQAEKLIGQYDADLVVSLLGVNDMLMTLMRDKDYRTMDEEDLEYHKRLWKQSFQVNPNEYPNLPAYKRTRIWRGLRRIKNHYLAAKPEGEEPQALSQDKTGSIYIEWRNNRRNASRIRASLPDLSRSLAEYRQNLNSIIDSAEINGAEIVLVTQPYLWRADLPPEVVDLFWLGGVGDFRSGSGNEFYSVEALGEAMDTYNAALLEVCEERSIDCIDLAAELPQDASFYYDAVHFTELGARNVADIVTRHLLASGSIR